MIHVFLGNILIVFLGFRFVYFFIGPDHSRLSDLVKLNAWKTILISFWERKKSGPLNWSWGHHPVASFFYLIVYIAFSGLALSGVILSRVQFDQGFIPERFYDDVTYLRELMQTHEILAWTVLGFTLMHLSALFYHQKKDKLPVFQAMKTGFQYRHIPKKVPGDFYETDQI
jgi:cytochrome b